MMYSDPLLMRYVTGSIRTPVQTRARLEIDLSLHRTYGFGLCIAESLETGTTIGRCGLIPTPTNDGLEGELACMFGVSWWGHGLASEAGAALLSFGLDELELRRVFGTARMANAASIRLMEKLGMRRVGVSRGEVEYEARPCP